MDNYPKSIIACGKTRGFTHARPSKNTWFHTHPPLSRTPRKPSIHAGLRAVLARARFLTLYILTKSFLNLLLFNFSLPDFRQSIWKPVSSLGWQQYMRSSSFWPYGAFTVVWQTFWGVPVRQALRFQQERQNAAKPLQEKQSQTKESNFVKRMPDIHNPPQLTTQGDEATM